MKKELLIQKMIQYHSWADNLIISTVTRLSEEQFNRPLEGKLRSAKARVVHMVSALKTWISRLEGKPIEFGDVVNKMQQLSKDQLLQEWRTINLHLERTITSLSPNLDKIITYQPSLGGACSNEVEDILFHVINHATYHRAQLILILRTLGMDFPNSDYIHFLRNEQVSTA